MSLFLRALFSIVAQYNTTGSQGVFKAVLNQNVGTQKHDCVAVFECDFKSSSPASHLATEKMGLVF